MTSTKASPIARLNTEQEEAARLNVSRRTLQAWRVRGEGPPFVKLGRAVRYSPADVDHWIETRSRRHTSDPGHPAA